MVAPAAIVLAGVLGKRLKDRRARRQREREEWRLVEEGEASRRADGGGRAREGGAVAGGALAAAPAPSRAPSRAASLAPLVATEDGEGTLATGPGGGGSRTGTAG